MGTFKLLLIGHGRMGRLVEALAPSYDAEIVGIITSQIIQTSGAGSALSQNRCSASVVGCSVSSTESSIS